MDLNTVTPNTNRLEIRHPATSEPTGLVVIIKPDSHPDVKAFKRRAYNDNYRKGKSPTAEKIEANGLDLLAAAIEGWEWNGEATWNGEKPSFTPQVARAVMKEKDWIRKQIDEALGDESAFFEDSGTN